MGQAQARAETTSGLTPNELVSAQEILERVAALRDALHQLEYLERLPVLIGEQEKRLKDLEQQQLDKEQQLRMTQTAIVQAETALNQAEAKLDALGAERPPRIAPSAPAPPPGAAQTPEAPDSRRR